MNFPGYAETVTVVRAQRDRHGDPVAMSEHVVAGCAVGLQNGSEDVSDGDELTVRVVLYAPSTADIVATDRVRRPEDPNPGQGADLARVAPWIVVGEPKRWRSPFDGWAPGVVVQLERVTG